MKFVPPASVVGAFLVSQLMLLLLLIPRFWQRGVVVTYYLQNMVRRSPCSHSRPRRLCCRWLASRFLRQ